MPNRAKSHLASFTYFFFRKVYKLVVVYVVVVVVVSEKKVRKKVCPYCGYEWIPRVEKPKRCPRCQRWLPEWKYISSK